MTPWQWILAAYMVLLHIISVLFTARAFQAIGYVHRKICETSTHYGNPDKFARSPEFAIIIPAYKEEPETLHLTLAILASHELASYYHVYLAMEEREVGVHTKAMDLIASFKGVFRNMSFTLHPGDLPNEAPGKSSNEAWAAKKISEDFSMSSNKENVVVVTMDEIARLHLDATSDERARTIYIPPLVFDRNLHHVPLPVRTTDMMWAGAGISNLGPSSTVSIPTSVYSLPLGLVQQVSGWDVDTGAIGEDLHMYLKCFFALSGELRAKVVFAAASQCNVASGNAGIRGYVEGLWARYRQAVRHTWGSLDTGAPKISYTRVLAVFRRLFEAHFIPAQLPFLITASSIYEVACPRFLVPSNLQLVLDFCGYCRFTSYLMMLAYLYRYEKYHQTCVGLRKEEMRRAGLLALMDETDSFSPNAFCTFGLIEAALFPIGGVLFGTIPAIHSTLFHLFTEKLTYQVSLKPRAMLTRRDTEKANGSLFTHEAGGVSGGHNWTKL
ncbi:hypothetical protein KC366_g10174 [Hortaea werneckii]|nr:hypothetical protein KC358_g1600 [Hortaea werneckii]KAI7030597.1 hypothetical protein KC366_g10174 [Hortaea werneckii]KAI7030787.1 hypothetical protein KC362_g9799 [Hortaea werneckii]KAI7126337.1 hypothetical protein KC337_g9929 [Hortaea werneckii]KAI7224298.1 hypothetical protein KC365_g10805 [Hortaea werneckii]